MLPARERSYGGYQDIDALFRDQAEEMGTAHGRGADDRRPPVLLAVRRPDAEGPVTALNYHFSGVAGSGMNPLARLMRARGHRVQGSDRALDQGLMLETAALLRGEGIALVPHDGAAIGAGLDRFVYSTAVEAETPEWRAARALAIPMLPRPAFLAELVNAGRPGVAISGTCGKSTVTGLVAWLVETGGRSATVIGGAPRIGEGIAGGLSAGLEDGPTIAETCESDGTLTGYRPDLGVIHNISRILWPTRTPREF